MTTVIPGRREAVSPESITTGQSWLKKAVKEPQGNDRRGVWIPGSRDARPGMTTRLAYLTEIKAALPIGHGPT